jgi:hypothetical protein
VVRAPLQQRRGALHIGKFTYRPTCRHSGGLSRTRPAG